MLNIVRPGSVLTELLGQSLYEVRQELEGQEQMLPGRINSLLTVRTGEM